VNRAAPSLLLLAKSIDGAEKSGWGGIVNPIIYAPMFEQKGRPAALCGREGR